MPIKKAWSLTKRALREAGSTAQTVGRAAWEIDNAIGSGPTRRGALKGANAAMDASLLALRGIGAAYDATAGRATDAITSRIRGQDTTGPAKAWRIADASLIPEYVPPRMSESGTKRGGPKGPRRNKIDSRKRDSRKGAPRRPRQK